MGNDFFQKYGIEPTEDYKRAAATLTTIEKMLGIVNETPKKEEKKIPFLKVIKGRSC